MEDNKRIKNNPFKWLLILFGILVMSGLASSLLVFNSGPGRFFLGIILVVITWAGCCAVEEYVSSKRFKGLAYTIAFTIIILGIVLQWTLLMLPENTVLNQRGSWESRRAEGPQLINPITTRVTDISSVSLHYNTTGIFGIYRPDTAQLVATYERFGCQDSLAAFIQREFQKQVDGFVARCGSTNPYCILCQFTADSLDLPYGKVNKLYIVP